MRKLGRYLINSKILACLPLYPPKPSITMRSFSIKIQSKLQTFLTNTGFIEADLDVI